MADSRPRRIATLLLLASTGCYSTDDAFIHRLAKLSCVNAKECESEMFETAFDSISDCRDQVESQLHDQLDAQLASCEYVAQKGRECIHSAYQHRKDCGTVTTDFTEACEGVFVCPAGLEPEQDPMSTALDAVLAVPEP
jgi:hypothetical protein